MNDTLELQLLESLELLDQGLTVEQILARNPENAANLRPFLETAAQVSRLALQPPVAAKQDSRRGFLNEAAALRDVRQKPSPFGWLRRGLLPLAGLAAIVVLFALGLVAASTTAMPGDALYQTKRVGEAVRLALLRDPERRAAFLDRQQQERLREVEALLRAGREAPISFEGWVELGGAAEWVVSGIRVAVGPDTSIEGMPHEGDLVRVGGITRDGVVAASRISLITAALPSPTPELAPTLEVSVPLPAATETPATLSPTPTPRPAVTPEEPPTATAPVPTVEPTRLVPPTMEASPAPGPTPTDDNGGQNGNDGDNHNDGDNANDNGNDQDNGDDGGQDNSDNNGNGDNNNDNDHDNNGNGDNNNGNDGDDGESNGNDNAGEGGNNNDQNNGNDHGGDDSNDNGNSGGNDNNGGD